MEINELVFKTKQGDPEAFGQLYGAFFQRIFKYVRIKIQNRQEAEDIVQEVFIKAYKGIPNLNRENLKFSAWLYKIASNTINDYFRKAYRTPEIVGIDENFNIPDKASVYKEIETKSDLEIAHSVFKGLLPVYGRVLELRFIREFSPAEIGKILNKSNMAVRLLQYRALKKFRVTMPGMQYQHA